MSLILAQGFSRPGIYFALEITGRSYSLKVSKPTDQCVLNEGMTLKREEVLEN